MTHTHVVQCVPGHTCDGGVATPCPTGRYGYDNLCWDCGGPAYYCPGATTNPVRVSDGHYSVGGTSNLTRTGQKECAAGTYCFGGEWFDCGSEAVWCGGSTSNPTTAQSGFYTLPVGVNASRRVDETECEAGAKRVECLVRFWFGTDWRVL